MCHVVLLLVVPALWVVAFNLDVDYPVVWSDKSPNFGYKLNISRNEVDGVYSLFAAAPKKTPVGYNDLCMAGTCFQCHIRDIPMCTPEHISFLETTSNKNFTFQIENEWLSNTRISFEPIKQDFKVRVVVHGSASRELLVMRGGEDELSGNIYQRAWCITDVNEDSLRYLVLGSPLSTEQDSLDGAGAVYIIYINKKEVYPDNQMQIIEGKKINYARFGKSVSCIGDVNNDGLQDIAVGAPGEDGGKGAIYIYLGSTAGLNTNFSQRIAAADVEKEGEDIRGFGIFISESADVDRNGYRDVAVGASHSGHIVLLKARPVVHLHATLVSNITKITNDKFKIAVTYMINFTAGHFQTSLEVEVWLRADQQLCTGVRADTSRSQTDGILYKRNITLHFNGTGNDTIYVALKRGVTISPKPIEVEFHYKLAERSREGFCETCPVVDLQYPAVATLRMKHTLSCGDHTCRTDLSLHAVLNKTSQVSPGKSRTMLLCVTVKNWRDPAFLTTVVMEASFYLPVMKKPFCRDMSTASKTYLECDVANPLTSEAGPRTVFLELIVRDIPASTHQLQLNVSVTSAGEEVNYADNFVLISLSEESSVPNWILPVSIIGGIIICVLLLAVITVVFKCQKCRGKKKEEDNHSMNDYWEPEYAVPGMKEEIYSRENELYAPSLPANV